jgi:hypothetical protein
VRFVGNGDELTGGLWVFILAHAREAPGRAVGDKLPLVRAGREAAVSNQLIGRQISFGSTASIKAVWAHKSRKKAAITSRVVLRKSAFVSKQSMSKHLA